MSEQEKKISPALQTVIDFGIKVRETSPKFTKEDGNTVNEYYVSKLTFEPRFKEPDKKDPVFSLNNHKGESIKFTLSRAGNLKSAIYFDKNRKEDDKVFHKFVGKDFAELSKVVSDKGLAAMAGNLNWEKVQVKEQETPEVENEMDDIELD